MNINNSIGREQVSCTAAKPAAKAAVSRHQRTGGAL